MKVIESVSLSVEQECFSCKSKLLIEPQDWSYIGPQMDYGGGIDPECLVCNCQVCNQQIVLEERTRGMRGIFNAIKKQVKG